MLLMWENLTLETGLQKLSEGGGGGGGGKEGYASEISLSS